MLAPRALRAGGAQRVRHMSTSVFRIDGGRSSVSGVTATVFGSTGFLGRYVVNKFGRVGSQVVVPHRFHDHDKVTHLKVMGDLGMIVPVGFHARDQDSIAYAVEKSDVVINLLGKQELSMNFNFFGSNVETAGTIAQVCKKVGVPQFIHVSSVAASETSPSEFLRCKAQGELEVKEYYPDATIFRVNAMYGEEDRFLNLMANWTKMFGMIPIVGNGDNKLKPVYVDDVAEAIRAVVFDQDLAGKTYELNGPEEYTVRQIGEWLQKNIWCYEAKVRSIAPDMTGYLPEGAAWASPHKIGGNTLDALYRAWPEAIPGFPRLLGARGDCNSMTVDWLPHKKMPQIEDLGITPQNMKEMAPEYLRHYRQGGHFVQVHNEERP